MFSVVLGNVKATVFNRWMREMWQKFKGILPASSHDMLQILRACCNIQSRKNKMEKSNHKESWGRKTMPEDGVEETTRVWS